MKLDLFTESSAVISDDGLYRYRLSRIWDRGTPPVCFVMLNPSTADAFTNDATIRRCVRYAHSWKWRPNHPSKDWAGYGGLEVVNLFAYRATDPLQMMKADDPVGPDNDRHIIETCKHAGMVVCAWGVHGVWRNRDDDVLQLLLGLDITPHYLQRTGNGSPRHPLYLRADLRPQPMTLNSQIGRAA